MSSPRKNGVPDDGDRKGGKWAAVIAALLTERTVADAARRAGVGASTVRRWMHDPRFLRLYRRARRALIEAVIGRLQSAAAKAVVTLEKNLDCPEPGPANRAAVAIIEYAVRGLDSHDVLERLDELERTLAEVRSREAARAEAERPTG